MKSQQRQALCQEGRPRRILKRSGDKKHRSRLALGGTGAFRCGPEGEVRLAEDQ